MTIKEVIEYEFMSSLQAFRRIDTWMYIVSFLAIIFALLNKTVLLIITLLGLIILEGKKDYDMGKVKAYQREKYLKGGNNANQERNAIEQA
jgi:hypothetical protein